MIPYLCIYIFLILEGYISEKIFFFLIILIYIFIFIPLQWTYIGI